MGQRNKWILIASVILLLGVGLFFYFGFSKKKNAIDTQAMNSMKRAFVLKSLKESQDLTREAVSYLQQKQVSKAIDKFWEAIKIFPPNNEAYEFLLKIYLMTRQEQKIYETLESAGRSYPAFDQILKVIDDENLSKIPITGIQEGDVYIAPFRENKKMAISFMFDDGETSVYTGVLPLFDKYNYKATISLVGAQVTAHSGDPYRGSWDQWKDAAERGFEIANHSMHHLDAKKLKPEDYAVEIDASKSLIEKNVGKRVFSYVFPLDNFSAPVLEHVLKTHAVARVPSFLRSVYERTVDIMYGGPNFSVTSANRLVDISFDRNLWLIAECHGLDIHSKWSYKPLTADFLSAHLEYINKRNKDIWVDTFSSVFGYLMIRKTSQVFRKDVAPGQSEILLRSAISGKVAAVPLTVVLKVPASAGSAHVSAMMSDGSNVKAWACGDGLVCVDVLAYDQTVRVTWGGGSL